MTHEIQQLIKRWHDKSTEQATLAGRLGLTIGGKAAAAEAAVYTQCIHDLIAVVCPPIDVTRETQNGV
jgi:hypothetical protein